MSKIAIVAALEREVAAIIKPATRVRRDHEGRSFIFFERDELVVVCGGIGVEPARRAAEAIIALYRPVLIYSAGFAGALDASLRAGDLFTPSLVLDARDGSRIEIAGGKGILVTFMAVAGIEQKMNLAQAYGAQAVDMEAAAVAAAACAHKIAFAVTKVISDEYDFEMPGMDRFIHTDGRFNTRSFVAFAALRPWLWSRVATLASNSRKAAQSLGTNMEHYQRRLCDLAEAKST
jgi:adenosylhomocysteine nucleosidase